MNLQYSAKPVKLYYE